MRTVENRRIITTPNSVVKYAHDDDTGRDYAFLHLREPHAMGEDYTEAVVALLEHLDVTEYCRIGGMYDSVPHTRPLLVTGTFRGSQAERVGGLVSSRGSSYQGPTSIVNLVNDMLAELDVETCSLMVHLPQYARLNEDHLGAYRLVEVLCALFALPGSLADAGRGQEQYKSISRMVKSSPEVGGVITRLEAEYDRMQASGEPEEPVTLPPDIENFLREIGGKLEERQDDE